MCTDILTSGLPVTMSVLGVFPCIIFLHLLCYVLFVTAGSFCYIFKFWIYFDHFWLAFVALIFDGSISCQTIFIYTCSMQLYTLCNMLLYFVTSAHYNFQHFFNKQSSKVRKFFIFCIDDNIHSAGDIAHAQPFSS